jgi:bacteriocin biosynthesis cyclodehydratase domain-containing protein
MNSTWQANPQWRLDVHDNHLIASAGCDEIFVVDEAPPESIAPLLKAWHDNQCAPLANDPLLGAAIRQLRRLGALVPSVAISSTTKPHAQLRWFGAPWPQLQEALEHHGWCIDESATLVLCIRTTATWEHFLANYEQNPPSATHVLIDLPYHHTVCLGPLVVPGQTACLACLGHRVMHRWGDLPPPQEPTNQQRAWGVAALLADSVMLGSRCVEKSVVLDLHRLHLQSTAVYAQPGCAVCGKYRTTYPSEGPEIGALQLPWLNDGKVLQPTEV